MRWDLRWTVAVAGFMAILMPSVLSAGQPLLAQSTQSQPPTQLQRPTTWQPATAQGKTYIHPVRKFTLGIPPGAEFAERGETAQLSIRSRRGYMINVQTGDVNRSITLPRMAAKLEARYLGKGKPWSQKIAEKESTLAGLDALEMKYEGAGTRIRVVIARGLKTDFVFFFFAPLDAFEKLETEFEWMLANFKPNPADNPATAGVPAIPGKRTGPPAVLSKRFAEPGYGYTIQYPGDWEVNKPADRTVTFSGRAGSESYVAEVSIQNVQPPGATTPEEAAKAALADLKATLKRDARELEFIGERPLIMKSGRLSLSGWQMVVTYTLAGKPYRKWVLAIPRPAGTVAHIWSYTAPDGRFSDFQPRADAMLKSWTIRPDGG